MSCGMENSVDPDQLLLLHCFQLSLYLFSYSFKEFVHGIVSKVRSKHYLFFGISKIFIGQVHYGHLFYT